MDSLFNGYRVSIWNNESISKIDRSLALLNLLNVIDIYLKVDEMENFAIYTQ